MNNFTKLCFALALALPLAACGEKSAKETMQDAGNTMAAGWENLKAEAAKATDAAGESISQLETKASTMTGEAKIKLDAAITNIKAKTAEIVELSKDKSAAAADKLKQAMADLKQMIHEATAPK